jgi:murein DD-endopeptidase MepM/ murein hydrolase activator NlpD
MDAIGKQIDAVQLHVVPRRVYAACDGVAPQWRFLLVAINTSDETIVLERVSVALLGAARRARRIQCGDRIRGIAQGARQVPAGDVVVLRIQEGTTARTLPSSVETELVFRDSKDRLIRATRQVPLEAHPTVYLRFPLSGWWTVVQARTKEHCIGRQFGFDLIAEQDVRIGERPPQEQKQLMEFASYGQAVLSPGRGTVVACVDDQPDLAAMPGKKPVFAGFGNYAMIITDKKEHVWMAHFMRGSLRVKVGSPVREGQQIAQVGNSGTSSQPHLHIEMLDGVPSDLTQAVTLDFAQSGIPFGFTNVICERRRRKRTFAQQIVPRRMDILSAAEAD